MKIIVTPDDWSNARIVPSAELATAIAALAPGQYDLAFATPQGNFEVKPVDVPEDPPVNVPTDPAVPPPDPVDVSPVKLSVMGGRVAILNVEAPGSVRQVDGSFALDLSAVHEAETRTFTAADGQQVTLDIAAPSMRAKWGEGIHYMLERDTATEDLIIEPGRNHRKVYVTNGSHGYTQVMIAAEVGGRLTAAQITTDWLKANPTWGASPEKALAFELGMALWQAITGNKGLNPKNLKVSHWLLLECGYTYDNSNIAAHFIPEKLDGESLLHPALIGRYGSGHPPIIKGRGLITFGPEKLVIVGISNGTKAIQRSGKNIIRADLISEPESGETGFDVSVDVESHTFYRCAIADVVRLEPNSGAEWSAHIDRLSGLYMNSCNHALIEDCFFDHNGWKDGFDPVVVDFKLTKSQPPSIYSHNMYLSWDNRDVTMIGTLTARASSMGLQMRSGGRIQDSLFLDNQMAGFSGHGENDYAGNYTLVLRNFFTSASYYNKFPGPGGAFKDGFEIQAKDSSSIDNVVAHLANPNDPTEKARKRNTGNAFWFKDVPGLFDNHISVNWEQTNRNIDGLDMAQINARTIQNFAATKLPKGTEPSIKNFLNWMKTLTPRQRQVITREALAYLREPYDANLEMSVAKRTTPAVCVFRPDPRGEGFLWDNPLNWSTGDLPGTVEGDTVDLSGNFVRFGRLTVSIPIDFNGGKLDVVSGKLTCTAQTDLADVTVRNSGQYFAPENAHGSYIVSGGRLAFTGAAAVDLDVSGEAECLIGPALTIMDGVIQGADCWVGWDGTGTATATGPLAIMEVGGKVGKLQRFKRRGDAPNPTINATYALTALNIDVTTPGTYDLGGGAGTGVTYTNPDSIALPAGVTLKGGKLTLVVS